MNRKYGKIVIFSTIITAFVAATSAMAANVSVVGNTIMINSNTNSAALDTSAGIGASNTSGIGFGSVTIDIANTINTINGSDFIRLDDNRGKNSGWNVTVAATDFTAIGINDLSLASGSGTIDVAIPASAVLIVTPQNPTVINSSDATNVTVQNAAGIPVTNGTGVKVLSAAKGYGQGVYKQELRYTVAMPNYLPASAVITATNAASQFTADNRTAGAKIGLFRATYVTTVSYNVTNGP